MMAPFRRAACASQGRPQARIARSRAPLPTIPLPSRDAQVNRAPRGSAPSGGQGDLRMDSGAKRRRVRGRQSASTITTVRFHAETQREGERRGAGFISAPQRDHLGSPSPQASPLRKASLRLSFPPRSLRETAAAETERNSRKARNGIATTAKSGSFTYARYPRYPQSESPWANRFGMSVIGRGRDDRPATVESLPSHSRSEAASCPTRQSRQWSEGPGG